MCGRPRSATGSRGEESDGAQHVPAGRGLGVVRRGTRRGHTYHLLAAQRGPRKTFEPFLVTLTDKSEEFPGFQHRGTEFIHILSGTIRVPARHRELSAAARGFAHIPRRHSTRAGEAREGTDPHAVDHRVRLSGFVEPASRRADTGRSNEGRVRRQTQTPR